MGGARDSWEPATGAALVPAGRVTKGFKGCPRHGSHEGLGRRLQIDLHIVTTQEPWPGIKKKQRTSQGPPSKITLFHRQGFIAQKKSMAFLLTFIWVNFIRVEIYPGVFMGELWGDWKWLGLGKSTRPKRRSCGMVWFGWKYLKWYFVLFFDLMNQKWPSTSPLSDMNWLLVSKSSFPECFFLRI